MALNFWSSYLHLLGAKITGPCYHTGFMRWLNLVRPLSTLDSFSWALSPASNPGDLSSCFNLPSGGITNGLAFERASLFSHIPAAAKRIFFVALVFLNPSGRQGWPYLTNSLLTLPLSALPTLKSSAQIRTTQWDIISNNQTNKNLNQVLSPRPKSGSTFWYFHHSVAEYDAQEYKASLGYRESLRSA